MKPNQEPETDRALDQAMAQWVVEAPLPARFQEQVWQRVGRVETRPELRPTFWDWLRAAVETRLPRPGVAYSYVAILVLLGILSGAWAAQRETHRLNATLGTRYVQSLDPFTVATSQ